MTNQTFLVWDLGGTKCGAAHVEYNGKQLCCEQMVEFKLSEFKSLDELVDRIEAELNLKHEQVDRILIAGAGTYNGHSLELENPYPFEMDFARIANERYWKMFKVAHDYLPVLCATFLADYHHDQHVIPILPGKRDPRGRHVVFGVGTGLGVKDGALISENKVWVGSNEMGHVGITFPPLADEEDQERHYAFMEFLQETINGPITFEKVLSGEGLARIHQFCVEEADVLPPHKVSKLLIGGDAADTVAMFAWYLGLFIGCLQLTFMPTGGLWLTGGVLKKNPMLAMHPELKRGIQAHPAYQHIRQDFPLDLIISDELAFLGGAWYLGMDD